jgi:hypothetical protein
LDQQKLLVDLEKGQGNKERGLLTLHFKLVQLVCESEGN